MTRHTITNLFVSTNVTLAALMLIASVVSAEASAPAISTAAELHVCSTGCAFTSIQAAVDAASDGDLIKIAEGTYTGVSARAGVTQVVYISKSVTLQGGYTMTNWTASFPITQPSILDAQGKGRVLYIIGNISPTVEGIYVTNGNATGLGGGPFESNSGGGIYIVAATTVLSGNHVLSNTAGYGGGIALIASASTLTRNIIRDNTGYLGGGLFLQSSEAVLNKNMIATNTASEAGGGLGVYGGALTLNGNTLITNTASGEFGGGGGAYIWSENVVLSGNIISANIASAGYGGGLRLVDSRGTISDNTIVANIADVGGGGLSVIGPVLIQNNLIMSNAATSSLAYASDCGGAMVSGGVFRNNTVTANIASNLGGGICASGTTMLDGNTILSNTADTGGGLYLGGAILVNNIVADNRADRKGSGIYIDFPISSKNRLWHTTIARNTGGDGSGIYDASAGSYGSVDLINTILVSQTVGITVSEGCTATLQGTLWGSGVWANVSDSGGAGGIVTDTINVWGDPGFMDPANGNYYITAGSAAVDAGVPSNVATDINGDPRPASFGYDIGADERPGASLRFIKLAPSTFLNPGQTITYTLIATSVGVYTATNIQVADTLPILQQAVAITSTQGNCTTSTDWGGNAACDLGTLALGNMARVTLTAQITTLVPAELPQIMRNTAWITATEASNATSADTKLHNCHARLNDSLTEYASIQAAVDASTQSTDIVKVSGTCLGVEPGHLIMAHISKTLTLQGGWNPAFTERDVISYPTTLNALGQGRVLWVEGDISPTIEGLHITGGNTGTGMYGEPGGGIYVINAQVTIRDNWIFNNTAIGFGGGLSLGNSAATLSGNSIISNSAWGGGGLMMYSTAVTLTDNIIASNTSGDGGGVYLLLVNAGTLSGNTIISNSAASGGGLFLFRSAATLVNNMVINNQADRGSGVLIYSSPLIRMLHTTIARNTGGDGSGVHIMSDDIYGTSTVALTNTILVSQTIGVTATAGSTVTLDSTLWGIGAWANERDSGGAGTIITGTRNYQGDPAFVNPDGGDYHIGATSTARNAGVFAGVATDIDNQPRDWAPDLGADEYRLPGIRYVYLPLIRLRFP